MNSDSTSSSHHFRSNPKQRGRPRTDPETDPVKLQAASRAYRLYVEGYSFTAIGKKLGLHHETISSYVAAEGKRRTRELRDTRELEYAVAVDTYRDILTHCLIRITQGHNCIAELKSAIATRTRLDLLLGLSGTLDRKEESKLPCFENLTPEQYLAILKALPDGSGLQ